MNEAAVQNHIRMEAARLGDECWRNNVGVLVDATGRPVRYGLANDSKKLNQSIKSSDLIGITSLVVMPEMVGQVLGVFTAVECKHSNWRFNPSSTHDLAQAKFHDIVRRAGGLAGFATSTEEYRKITRR